jgi:nucleoside-diphosphate-sugar epimerase
MFRQSSLPVPVVRLIPPRFPDFPLMELGFVGQKLAQLLLTHAPDVKLILTDVVQPPNFGISDESKVKAVKADLGNMDAVKSLFQGEKVGIIYALQ